MIDSGLSETRTDNLVSTSLEISLYTNMFGYSMMQAACSLAESNLSAIGILHTSLNQKR
jgi:hypothetical protein